ncbi:unnamed protein product [Bursaphelenchus xylophilus]|uniref:(pine wood nematode) hypothetical protein n=1 Tax=Bursaphelenchus xylophilus TaxID=6326 RepID=A0A1I7SAP5_BURXY|nr:unnamed protein product [Bursaphelenchus xylophilus]CAG9126917.1 unnamed protein product [Bursaphelenchus xylophilus]
MLLLSVLFVLLLGIHVELVIICGKKKKVIKSNQMGIAGDVVNDAGDKPPMRKVEKSERLSIHGSEDDEEVKMPPMVVNDVPNLRSQATQASQTRNTEDTQEDASQGTAQHKSINKSAGGSAKNMKTSVEPSKVQSCQN